MELKSIPRDEIPQEVTDCRVVGRSHSYYQLAEDRWIVMATVHGPATDHAQDAMRHITPEGALDLFDFETKSRPADFGIRDDVLFFAIEPDPDPGSMDEETARYAALTWADPEEWVVEPGASMPEDESAAEPVVDETPTEGDKPEDD